MRALLRGQVLYTRVALRQLRAIWPVVVAGLAALALAGCSPISSDIIQSLATSDRSWCVAVSTVYGTIKMGGSGAQNSTVLCNQEGLKIDGAGGIGSALAPGGAIILPAQPRILQQEAPTFRELEPPPNSQRRAPAIRPQSSPAWPSGPSWRVREVLDTNAGYMRQ